MGWRWGSCGLVPMSPGAPSAFDGQTPPPLASQQGWGSSQRCWWLLLCSALGERMLQRLCKPELSPHRAGARTQRPPTCSPWRGLPPLLGWGSQAEQRRGPPQPSRPSPETGHPHSLAWVCVRSGFSEGWRSWKGGSTWEKRVGLGDSWNWTFLLAPASQGARAT